jgi:hypothetical protein
MVNLLKEFWVTSYKTDKLAFYLEVFSVTVTIAGSWLLTFTSPGPDMRMVFPLYLLGSSTLAWASFRRRIIWTCVLASSKEGSSIRRVRRKICFLLSRRKRQTQVNDRRTFAKGNLSDKQRIHQGAED